MTTINELETVLENDFFDLTNVKITININSDENDYPIERIKDHVWGSLTSSLTNHNTVNYEMLGDNSEDDPNFTVEYLVKE